MIILVLFMIKCFLVYYVNRNVTISRMVASQCEYSMGLFVMIMMGTITYAGFMSSGSGRHAVMELMFADGVWIALIIMVTEMVMAIYANTLMHVAGSLIRKKRMSRVGRHLLARQISVSIILLMYSLGVVTYFSLT